MPPVRIEEVPNLAMDDGFRVPRVDPKIAAAPAKALGNVAESIASVGEQFHAIAQQAQENVNAHDELSRRLRWNEEGIQHFRDLDQSGDPAKYVPATTGLLEKQKAEMDASDLPPVVRERLGSLFEQYASGMRTQAGAGAARASAGLAAGSFKGGYDLAVKTRDRALLKATVDAHRDGLGITPEKAAGIFGGYDRELARAGLASSIDNDPAAARAVLDGSGFPGFPAVDTFLNPREKQVLMGKLKESEEKHRLQQVLELRPGWDSGAIGSAEVMKLGPDLHPDDHEMLATAEQQPPPPVMDGAAEMMVRTAGLQRDFDNPAVSQADYMGAWAQAYLKNGTLQEGPARDRIDRFMTRFDPDVRRKRLGGDPAGLTPEDLLLKEANVKAAGHLQQGVFGPYEGAAPEEQERARSRYYDVVQEIGRYVEDHPGKIDDARARMNQLLGQNRIAQVYRPGVSAVLFGAENQPPSKSQKQQELDARLSR